jgi:hypothetical protein
VLKQLGDPDAVLSVEPVGTGTAAVVEEVDKIYNTAGIEVKPDFPGGIEKFTNSLVTTIKLRRRLKGKVYVTFVVEKDGSLTDIKVIEWLRYWKSYPCFEKCPKWTPGEQNGKKVRVLYSSNYYSICRIMLNNILIILRRNRLKSDFFLFKILFFCLYLVLGLFIIFMNNFPLDMQPVYRVAFEFY